MFTSLGFPGEAVVEAEKAVALDANNATALAGLASALVQAEQPAEGLDYLQPAMRLDPHHPPSYRVTLGAAQFGMEHFEEAAATFERAVKRNPDNKLPLIYLDASYGHLGRIKDGDAALEAANDRRDQAGWGSLSLERDEQQWDSPFEGGREDASGSVEPGIDAVFISDWSVRGVGA